MKIYLDTAVAKKAKAELIEKDRAVDFIVSDSPIEAIDKLLKKNKLAIEEIENFDFNSGPGSFTGLRVGAAVVNTLNWALGRKSKLKKIIYK